MFMLCLFGCTLRLTAGESLIPESSLFIRLPRINTMAAAFNVDLLLTLRQPEDDETIVQHYYKECVP